MPVIRYRTQDLTCLLPGTPPGEISAMRRMGRIIGRSDDRMIILGVEVFPTPVDELLFRCPRLAPHFYIELTRRDRMDEMNLVVEAKPDATGFSATRLRICRPPAASQSR